MLKKCFRHIPCEIPPNSCANCISIQTTRPVLSLCRARGANSASLCQTEGTVPDADSDPAGIKHSKFITFYILERKPHTTFLFLFILFLFKLYGLLLLKLYELYRIRITKCVLLLKSCLLFYSFQTTKLL